MQKQNKWTMRPQWSLALLATACLCGVDAQIPGIWRCPDYAPQQNFEMNKFAGRWYEVERTFALSEAGSRCASTNYTVVDDGRIVVANEQVNRVTNVKRVLEGEVKYATRAGEAKLTVTYPNVLNLIPYETTYSVLGTDYDSYAVVWSCFNAGIANMQNVWIMTRERVPAANVLQSAYGVLDRLKIAHNYFVKTIQDDCDIVPQYTSTAAPSTAAPSTYSSAAQTQASTTA
ncbi:apolipoprotein D-like isoform X2 [Bacillus rossius redtenbacheri]|uniref:apolipoprotein D-like isoform X2 n=1 Tax=Bacillus rossius redtenbacheri TaxID=93214 RepID=UPI002FDC9B97